jgi:outer membrane protein TolC
LTWRLDYGSYATAQAQAAAAEAQAISGQQARRKVEDSIFDAYHRVQANIAKSASARAQASAAEKAARLSLDRYQAGAVTQLDVTQSQRDAFFAQAASIQADSDLALSRVLLRISAGKPAEISPGDFEDRSDALPESQAPSAELPASTEADDAPPTSEESP